MEMSEIKQQQQQQQLHQTTTIHIHTTTHTPEIYKKSCWIVFTNPNKGIMMRRTETCLNITDLKLWNILLKKGYIKYICYIYIRYTKQPTTMNLATTCVCLYVCICLFVTQYIQTIYFYIYRQICRLCVWMCESYCDLVTFTELLSFQFDPYFCSLLGNRRFSLHTPPEKLAAYYSQQTPNE